MVCEATGIADDATTAVASSGDAVPRRTGRQSPRASCPCPGSGVRRERVRSLQAEAAAGPWRSPSRPGGLTEASSPRTATVRRCDPGCDATHRLPTGDATLDADIDASRRSRREVTGSILRTTEDRPATRAWLARPQPSDVGGAVVSAPTPDFLPGSRPPVTPCEKAADAVWRFETYDGASLVTSRDCDGVARAALTAALGSVEETARVLRRREPRVAASYHGPRSCDARHTRAGRGPARAPSGRARDEGGGMSVHVVHTRRATDRRRAPSTETVGTCLYDLTVQWRGPAPQHRRGRVRPSMGPRREGRLSAHWYLRSTREPFCSTQLPLDHAERRHRLAKTSSAPCTRRRDRHLGRLEGDRT